MKKIFLLFTAICTTAVIKSNAQSTTPTNNFAPGRFLGYVAPFSGNLDFHTAQPAGGGSQMRLQLGTGFLGIGVVNPAFRLDVQDNISVRTVVLGDGYRILGSTVLHVFGSNNTFVGENNGLATTTGANNTFVGNDAGANNTVGNRNTFIGDDAGKTNATGVDNTFIGKGAGTLNIASTNTFVGSAAAKKITVVAMEELMEMVQEETVVQMEEVTVVEVAMVEALTATEAITALLKTLTNWKWNW